MPTYRHSGSETMFCRFPCARSHLTGLSEYVSQRTLLFFAFAYPRYYSPKDGTLSITMWTRNCNFRIPYDITGAIIARPAVPCCRLNLCPGEFAGPVQKPNLYFSKDSKPAGAVLFLFRQEKYPKETDLVGGVEAVRSRAQSHILRYDCHRQSL